MARVGPHVGEIDGLAGWVTLRVASRVSGLSHQVLRKRIGRGRLPAVHIENTVLVKWEDAVKARNDDRRYKAVRDARKQGDDA